MTDLRYVYNRELTIFGSFMAGKGELLKALELLKEKRVKPVVDSVFPLQEAATAEERLERSAHFGKIVLTV
jgi:NADPH:quinone reductase-like Zn-dependent oxidoreductase